MSMLSGGMFRVMLTLSLRSLRAHRITTAIVGSIIFFGTALVVVGTSLLDSVERAMAQSVVSSVAGHLQIYSAEARDDLALFGSGFMGTDDIGEIRDFAAVKGVVEGVENVEAVVPMGLSFATVSTPNEIDTVLERLRNAVAEGDEAQVAALAEQVRDIADDLRQERMRALSIVADQDEIHNELADLSHARSPDFWSRFAEASEEQLQFLDTRLAPLASDAFMIYLRYLGTDLTRFMRLFDRFEIVEGGEVPSGHRGMLIAKRVQEKQLKHKVARELDAIYEGIHEEQKTIATDPILLDKAKRLPDQYRRIAFQLAPEVMPDVQRRIAEAIGSQSKELKAVLQAFLTVDDATIDARHALFYEVIAPHIDLYSIDVGDTIALRAVTQSGYLKSVSVKVYGTFQFKSLEKSDLAGAQNLVDMITFRELYGLMTAEKQEELAGIRADVGVADVAPDDAEAALFGGDDSGAVEEELGAFEEFDAVDLRAASAARGDANLQTFSEGQVSDGLALNAAIILEDDRQLDETRAAIAVALREAGFDFKVVDWQEASGVVGQLILVIRIVLYVAIFVIFLVAVVILNNSMVMATMDRVTEIGTMRALGAQRRFVMAMFLVETVALSMIAGTLGAAAAAGLVSWLNGVGIPAASNIMVFLFSGPRLHPTFGFFNLVTGFVVVMCVSLVSTLYPARVATRIQPVVAMQVKE